MYICGWCQINAPDATAYKPGELRVAFLRVRAPEDNRHIVLLPLTHTYLTFSRKRCIAYSSHEDEQDVVQAACASIRPANLQSSGGAGTWSFPSWDLYSVVIDYSTNFNVND